LEAGTVGAKAGTGSKTMADLLPLAAERYAEKPAIKRKVGDDWADISYEQLGITVKEVALGLIELGIQPGERVSILAHTRPEWSYACFGILSAGATAVTIYQTNSPEECHYVLEHSESRAVFVEDSEQLAKVRKVEDRLPNLEHIVVMDPGDADVGDAVPLDDLRQRGREADEARWDQRYTNATPDDVCLYIYTSGTTGPPKGCILTHRNYRAITDMIEQETVLEEGDLTYLFLPLAHAFAILIQFASFDLGVTVAYWSRDPQQIVPDLMAVKPTYFPSVPRMFEKIYTLATSAAEDREKLDKAVEIGVKVRQMQARGEEVPEELRGPFNQADVELYTNVRNLFGGRLREATTGAAPIAPEILEFFYACGVPVLEGWGMTETATAATVNRLEDFRFGSVGKPLPGVEIKIADDGEILARGPNIFTGYYKNDEASKEALEGGWLHTGDLGHLDEDGFLYITGRKKDIIITSGGKNITPANLENGLKQSRWISQAVVVGDRRPYLVALITLDPEEVQALAEEVGVEPDIRAMSTDEKVRAEIQKTVDQVNSQVGPVEQIKRFAILPADLTQETGELTPTLKVKRNVVLEKYADEIDVIYKRYEKPD
jgi:long-chain acyl-CoA synthetase